MQLAPPDADHVLEMRESPLLLNHVGTIHASILFALAEAGSGEFLLRHLGDAQRTVFAVLRTSTVKFRKPAHGALRASARFAEEGGVPMMRDLESGRYRRLRLPQEGPAAGSASRCLNKFNRQGRRVRGLRRPAGDCRGDDLHGDVEGACPRIHTRA